MFTKLPFIYIFTERGFRETADFDLARHVSIFPPKLS